MMYGDYSVSFGGDVGENYKLKDKSLYLLAAPEMIPDRYRKNGKNNKGMVLYIINGTDSTVSISATEGLFYISQEAMDENGEWRPIEYLVGGFFCGASFQTLKLKPKHYTAVTARRYYGNFETEIRFRLNNYEGGKSIIYSNKFKGSINKNQFIFKKNDSITDFKYLITDEF